MALPKPSLWIQRLSAVWPRRWRAIVTVPTFDDSARICETVSFSVLCVARVLDRLVVERHAVRHREDRVSGVTTPCCSAAPIVTTLKVEPGS